MSLIGDVIGHDKQKRILLSALKRGREATSYLFSGESGIGKTTFALEYAKVVNCLQRVQRDGLPDACDSCASCRKISRLNHPDLKVVEPETDVIKIEQIREVTEFLSFSPFEGKKKVVIIKNAELMNQPSSNAFLKTLEEPPDDSLILLVTSSEEVLLETIRSRCFRIRFSPLNSRQTEEVLRRHAVKGKSSKGVFSGRPGLIISEEGSSLDDVVEGLLRKAQTERKWKNRSEAELGLQALMILLRELLIRKVSDNRDISIFRKGSFPGGWDSETLTENFIIEMYGKMNELRLSLRQNINLSLLSNYVNLCLEEINGRHSN
ncbi:MAG: DNA polymerase III subunit delta' [Nitrospirae bacterium]|nr:MAG: DNA polymerase III subunit delta' [Nitrospirota bacterium]